MKLIVGLGNPGQEYARNRHNLGFMCLAFFARKHGIKLEKKAGQARIGTGQINGEEVVVARPQTYMNRSGQAVSYLISRFTVNLDGLIVVHDDLDLPVGRIRIRCGGSAAGHRGIKSIIADLGSPDFVRIRVGIGRPEPISPGSEVPYQEEAVIAYVLSDFAPEERKVIEETIPRVSEAIDCLIAEGLTAAMNEYNQGKAHGA
ncbi:MAG: aminoacyl-tRNA hydrolase [Chloroflexi bacterium]|nr:aminoacyl-tRNA hydrolase [Chloroflexota bacterium]